MAKRREYDLGAAEVLEAEAIGPAGQRRFRLRVIAGDKTASIWCDKTQVSALAEAIQQVLSRHRRTSDGRRPASRPLEPFPDRATHDFLAGRIALGYDEDADSITLFATDIEQGGPQCLADGARRPQPAGRATVHRAGGGNGRRRAAKLPAVQTTHRGDRNISAHVPTGIRKTHSPKSGRPSSRPGGDC